MTPSQRHAGQDKPLLKDRVTVYELARQANPLRWSKQTRDWSLVQRVELNPDKPNIKDIESIRKVA